MAHQVAVATEGTPVRAKNSCWPCRQRKVKCSRNPIPCKNCIRRGEQSACVVDFESRPRPPILRAAGGAASPENHELILLRRKVLELENELQGHKSPSYHSSPIPNESPTMRRAVAPEPAAPAPADDDCASQGSDALIVEDAASILEFLAWGRQKNPDYHRLASPEATRGGIPGDIQEESTGLDDDSLGSLQMLLPSQRQVWQLVDYSDNNLLWFHGSYMPRQFRTELREFYAKAGGTITDRRIDLQWVSLLFSILTGSLLCAPRSQTGAWGFRANEQAFLSQKWSSAVMTLLHKAAYTANHSIYSVQAITTMTMSAHLLGQSNMQSIHLAAAVRIAQALGLHQLTSERKGVDPATTELGRRVWQQLCSQDWFNIPFSETYLINPLYSKSDPPVNCFDDGKFTPLPESVATPESYTRFLAKIAALMPHLLDDMTSCNTTYSRYHRVLAWDKQLRAMASERPPMLSNQPIEQGWPSYTEWARRSLAISSSHKIIMVHRSFLSESFRNPHFEFTRRTCIAASKTIIKEFKIALDDAGMPTFWTYQAFAVAACIILLLDVFHRRPEERECIEHTSLVRETITLLHSCHNSMIASRGVKLLSALLQNSTNTRPRSSSTSAAAVNPKKRNHEDDRVSIASERAPKRGPGFDMAAFLEEFHRNNTSEVASRAAPSTSAPCLVRANNAARVSINASDVAGVDISTNIQESLDAEAQFAFMDTITRQMPMAGADQMNSFENLLYLASHDFSII
ncbi:uncharacterized protein B0I36DRAFT_29947 [Microdochium trichocladiopsis]|uniref:Zn(2)-C6 fungal-type domain-containing protein n=1 Tax=Microdochium trichocladiopsis TaxID=1682393 RepID=A0A9P8XWH8_9PEZI|nr:uncharacterized protein B0I36DRAFT_29947 [Microdochium trichocladiopsis]KAH7021201.1 hypothetical protein B0I36DRAFT_29947 [Microdochium trichocladiopsis]